MKINLPWLLVLCLLLLQSRLSHAAGKDSLHLAPLTYPPASSPAITVPDIRTFEPVDKLLAQQLPVAAMPFTAEQLASLSPGDPETHVLREKAKAEYLKMEKSNHYVNRLEPDDLNELPIGLSNEDGTVKIAVSNATFHEGYAELTLYARVQIPQEPGELFFGVQGVKLSYEGNIQGDAKLVLLGDYTIRINGGTAALVLKGALDLQTGKGLDMTYVSIDCNGFKELGLSADIMFPRSMMVPVDAAGERIADEKTLVRSSFRTIVGNWNDILVGVSLPSFEITPLKGFTFHIGKAVYDGSDIRNAPDVLYPAGYRERYMQPGDENLWRGIYIEDLEVVLPRQFASRTKPGTRVSFGATQLLIDNNGLTGHLFAGNILPDGSASGWRFTVDRFTLDLEANHLTGASFDGTISLPVAKDPLAYTALITADNEYMLKVGTLNKLSFNIWKAKAELLPNSWVQLRVADGRFLPEAMLNGQLEISASNKQSNDDRSLVNFKGIQFRNLHLQTTAPVITAEYFGYKDDGKVAGFPVAINEIAVSLSERQAALILGVKLNLMEGKFGGATRIQLIGQMSEEDGAQRWHFDRLSLSQVAIKANLGALNIDGQLNIYDDDPVYGDAVSGSVKADIIGKIKVEARAMFGCKDFRYWYVDAKADFGLGIPLLPPMLNMQGFGGGAYYHMKKSGVDLQASPTGVNYVPDANTGLGIKATLLFTVGQKVLVNGDVTLEVAFNNSGGLNYIGFFGYAKILNVLPNVMGNAGDFLAGKFQKLADLENKVMGQLGAAGEALQRLKLSDPTKVAAAFSSDQYRVGENGLSAYLGMQYDFEHSIFHSNFDIYLNVAGGLLQGISTGNRAGWAVFHAGPGEWYMHCGTPTNPIGIRFGIGSVSLKVSSYLMAGDKIPGSPPPPQEVADILGVELSELDYMRDLNALGDGRGMAFGARLSVETGDLTFLILYANFKAGVGFDIMLKDYGDAHCKGSSDPIGIDGWYANGQAYVYLQGEVGVKVNLRFIKARFPILSGAAAVLMQAKLPNPTWIRGYLGVKFSVLGGLVSGKMRMKVTIGQECEIEGAASSPVDVKIISDLTPKTGSDKIDVFAVPQAAFNMKLNKAFDVDGDDGAKTYRIKLDEFTVTEEGKTIPGTLKWNDNNDVVSFYSKEVLPPQKQLQALVKVSFEELKGGSWQTVYMNGKKSEEVETVNFTTATAPDYIPLNNIAYAYPVVDQRNLYRNEYDRGYIRLKRGQTYLFDSRWKYELRMSVAGSTQVTSVGYNSEAQELGYDLPALKRSAGYQLDVVALPPGSNTGDAVASYSRNDNEEGGSFSVKNNQAQSVTRGDIAKSLLSYALHTSKHATFEDKMASLALQQGLAAKVSSDVVSLQAEVGSYEPFEPAELAGTAYTDYKPMVQPEAIMEDAYYREDINPLLYWNYPINKEIYLTHRNVEEWGIVPSRAITIMSSYLAAATNPEASPVPGLLQTRLPYVYDLPLVYKQDFTDLQYQLVNRYLGTPEQSKYAYLIKAYYPFIRYGKYKVVYRYILPGGKKGSSKIFEYMNPIK
ncbi:hypothetical protein [Chitinophaga qingshengii]|uniref:Uncharacterized protein n=1 Tax=Chitinophaga qingshengii TaxID=1569794 RepID=A0ABR7TT28_9BACT|nr:hypothetical protein [Chitinophaga qingshengii]MBC9932772.1 hypothetical protein [Chitinophaga qingshengii]